MARPVELLHITDSHLLAAPEANLHGWPVAAAFERVWRQALARHPGVDAVILGGDLVDDGTPAGYARLDACLAAFDGRVLAVAGNHEAPEIMATTLTRAQSHGPLAVGGWQIIGLNSHVPGHEHGSVGADALEWLARTLDRSTEPCLLVIHHPPVTVGTPWIDALGLSDREALAGVLATRPRVRGVLAGHVHQAGDFSLGGCPVWTTPSTMRQFLPGAATFAEDTTRRPGYRHLYLESDGRIQTTVHRLAD